MPQSFIGQSQGMPETTLPTVALPLALMLALWKWLMGRVMPKPVFMRNIQESDWDGDANISQWRASFGFRRGWFFCKDRIENCRLYLIRKDWGPPGEPEGIWLKWIENGNPVDSIKITLSAEKTYESTIVVRDTREGSAYIANERFISTDGREKKWELQPGRPPGINDPIGRYTFWLEIRAGTKRWRSEHYYVVTVPPAGENNDGFTLKTLRQYED